MNINVRNSVILVFLAGIVGCGGGIEAGVPAKPQEPDPVQKEQLKNMGKMMLKGPKSFGGPTQK